ncbi:hypothetical protein Enr13x_04800 [Stieleria neptunia]|uniref:Uncharacterized protein n=1 Tax=Stieleria neptunia TaxID=2527979 RepID=A0A518HIG7_9BACT|nr:hypothetical protein Enr13x_04800 [Stieleria neptunia]
MAKKLDQILVVDVESTCWDGPDVPATRHRPRRVASVSLAYVKMLAIYFELA